MRLKPMPRTRATPSTGGGRRPAARRAAARGGGRQARRPGVPLRQRLGRRMPSVRRALAVLGAAAAVAGLVAALNGPWLRVGAVGWSGAARTADGDVAAVLEPVIGTSILAVDTDRLGVALAALPSVETASVEADLTGRLHATITEPAVAFVWDTDRGRFLGAADGTLFAAEPNGALDEALLGTPRIVDARFAGRRLAVGDRIPEPLLDAAMRILAVDPVALGSTATRLGVRLDDEFGFRLVAGDVGWEAALGVYGIDPNESAAEAAARLERQVTAVRTLFADRPESNIGWVDVRNPGKVYFRAKG
jgi:cell division septal protein FtsQ